MSLVAEAIKKYLRTDLPDVRPGDHVRVWQKVKEGEKIRSQAFEGTVIARKHGKGISASFTVRKISGSIGVERTWPLHSPTIEKIEVLGHAKVRRAKLYYLREAKGKRRRMKRMPVVEERTPETPKESESTEGKTE
ncbi:50S ribosomal protein L19 [Candidatus Azambacteria bacterium]|nr:50S ribosomal protein L19 [Candidatus Azambacteria bacterium]